MCGFECGILLNDLQHFEKAQPWYEWMQETTDIGHWGILPDNMKEICAAADYYEAYGLIKTYAGDVGAEKVKECFQKAEYIIDKTPKYIYCLDIVMDKIQVPFIVIKKDIRTQYRSHKKRDGSLSSFIKKYERAMTGLRRAQTRYPDRILVVDYHDLLKNKDATLRDIYDLLNLLPYPNASLEEFFNKTGLRNDSFSNEDGGLRSNFTEHPDGSLVEYEEDLLKKIEHVLDQKSDTVTSLWIWFIRLKLKMMRRHYNPLSTP